MHFLQNYSFDEIYISRLKDHVKVKKADNLLYLPNLEDFGYVKVKEDEYEDFYAMIYKKTN